MNPSDPQHTPPAETTATTEAASTPVTPDAPPPLPHDAAAATLMTELPSVGIAPSSSASVETPLSHAPSSSSVETPVSQAPTTTAPRPPALPAQPVPSVPPAPQPHDLSRIAQDLQIRKAQVEAVVQLLDEENTIPFITRYRKERTGGLNEEIIRRIQERVTHLRELASRKQTILKSIANQGRLTDAVTQAILAAETPKRLEDLYLPFKPKKKSLATEAREKGLGPLAEAIWNRDPAVAKLDEVLPGLVDPDKWILNTDDVLAGVKHILADMVSDAADARGPLRAFTWDTGLIVANKIETLPEGKGREYEPYFSFKEPVKEIPPHRVLAINRGEKANALRVRVETDVALANEIAAFHLNLGDHPHRELLIGVVKDALERLVLPSLEREVRRELTERAQDQAVHVFAKNLRSLLLQPPLRGRKVLAVDPGIRTGCKLAVLGETGTMIEDAVVYPQGQKRNQVEARRKVEQLVRKHGISVIAIGNGTGCREAEQMVADLISDLDYRRKNPEAAAAAEAAARAPVVVAAPPAVPLQVTTEVPAPESSASIVTTAMAADAMTFLPPLTLVSTVAETTGTPAPESEAVTTGTHAPASHSATTGTVPPPATPTPPSKPLPPPISLEGLPDAPADLAYVIVIEAGASDYSASPIAREEFPELDATTRGTISIGRRLQDPLAELVKIDPQHIGVGLYQHDVKQKHLKESLEGVIESCVNQVGVDLNTASVPLLRHVSGMNQLIAREVVTYRDRNGAFTVREHLLRVPGLGEKRFTQAAGFLKIHDAADPLDTTWIHPESYPLARQILADFGFAPTDLRDKAKVEELRAKLNSVNLGEVAAKFSVGEPTIDDIFEALAKPGRDPREDLPPPIFKTGVLKLEDISPGMELKGTVLNVVPFGAFVDIGLKESGLVHISQMANRYIKSPYDVVAVGDVVSVWVIEVKQGEKKISLSMIAPGQERKPPARFQGGPPQRGERDAPPQQRGERDAPPRPQQQPQGDRPALPPRGDRPAFQPRGDRPAFPQRTGQGQGRQFNRGPGGPGGPPRPAGPPQGGQPAGQAPAAAPPPQPAPPPRKPSKPKPLPNLTAEKKSGKAALNTFAELAAFFKPEEPKPEVKPEPPKSEAPVEEPKPAEEPPTQS